MKQFIDISRVLSVLWICVCTVLTVSGQEKPIRLYADKFLNEQNGITTKHPKLKNRLGVSSSGSDERGATLTFKLKLDSPGRYVLSTHAVTDDFGSELMKVAKSKYESLFMDIKVNDQPKTKRVVCVPWNIARQVTGKFELKKENEINIWLPKGAVLDFIEIKPYVAPAIPEAAKNYTPKHLPPSEHPRLWVSKNTLPIIRANVEMGENREKWEEVKALALKDFKMDYPADGEISFDENLEKIAEAKAFYYLITQDAKVGSEAVSMTREYISRVVFGNILDITREIGRTIHISSEVYDWCYDLMTEEDKETIRRHLMRLADDMEIGWPPFLQSVVNGHGNEAQVNRDLLSMAIAIYNEDPLPYQYCAYAILEELVPMRKFEYQSPRHNQGYHYGVYRFTWDLHAAWLFYRMLDQEVFDPNIKNLGDYWIYSRTADGQMLRDGDQGLAGVPGEYHYWQMYPVSFFMNYAYSKNPYLKHSFERMTNTNINPVLFLLLNDPTFQSKKLPKDYPLTKDFGKVLGGMINRTGWEDGLESNDVVAEIKGGGYFFANHQHNDAGALQIYHRGIQVGDLGLYRFYGTPYDMNFNKRSISHSMMLAVDPNEKFGSLPSNDGGTRMRRTFPRSLHQVLNDSTYLNGNVISTAYGPDKTSPKFNYFSVDLTSAYSQKLKSYVRDYIFVNTQREDIPAIILLKDQMETSSPEFKKYWQANTLHEPVIDSNGQITFTNSRGGKKGLTYLDFIYPNGSDLTMQILSGDSTFNIFGYQVEPPLQTQAEAFGHRLMVSPTSSNTKDIFLTLFQMTNEGVTPISAQYEKRSDMDYITIDNVLIVIRDGTQHFNGHIELPIKDQTEVYIVGLAQGKWALKDAEGRQLKVLEVERDKNILYIPMTTGDFTLQYVPNSKRPGKG